MSFLRGSTNYVWCTTSVLGKGATGAVFQGVNKHNGETVAVKTFNQLSHMRPQEVQMREFEVLQKVKHENIVKLLAIEEEQEGRGKVIVMELCTGGSLFNLLDDPENNFGLDEDEWLLVLSHLSAGMNHLRDNNLVHRDLKPGNIMKFIRDDGTIVYKLTDFGAARELQDDQQFVSLYGTEEYLHPDMYERAVLRKPVGKTFGATVDLWSIGVTLYHVATGNLPFRPFGGRRNKETMYYITTKKASGVISGVQTSENGPIQWNRELPNTCLLSSGIKKHVTPLLAGLLEVNPQKMWTFEKFFSEVTRILSKKKIHIYYMTKLTEHRIYLDREENLEQFQLLLAQQAEVAPNNQILIFDKMPILHYVDDKTPGTSFPETGRTQPVILYSKENNNVSLGIEKELPPFPTLPNLVSVENDATLAKSACAVGYAYQRKIEVYGHCSEIVAKAVKMLAEVIISQLEKLQEILDRCKAMTKLTQAQLGFFKVSHSNQGKILEALGSTAKDNNSDGNGLNPDEQPVPCQNMFSKWSVKLDQFVAEEDVRLAELLQQLADLSPAIQQLNKRCVIERQLIHEWDDAIRDVPSLASCAAKSRTYVTKLKESWQHLLRDRASRTLTYNDEQFHILEKIKMQETMRDLVDLLQKQCHPTINQLTELLADWYKMAQTTYLQAEILQKDITNYQNSLETFSIMLKDAEEKYTETLTEALGTINEHQSEKRRQEEEKSKSDPNHHIDASALSSSTTKETTMVNGAGKSSQKMSSVQVRRALRSILIAQDEVWGILHENFRLIEHFGQLAVGSSISTEGTTSNAQQILAELDNTFKY